MIELVKKFFTDETAAVGAIRGGLLLLGGLAAAGALPIGLPVWVGPIAMGIAGFIRAGDKNETA